MSYSKKADLDYKVFRYLGLINNNMNVEKVNFRRRRYYTDLCP